MAAHDPAQLCVVRISTRHPPLACYHGCVWYVGWEGGEAVEVRIPGEVSNGCVHHQEAARGQMTREETDIGDTKRAEHAQTRHGTTWKDGKLLNSPHTDHRVSLPTSSQATGANPTRQRRDDAPLIPIPRTGGAPSRTGTTTAPASSHAHLQSAPPSSTQNAPTSAHLLK